MTSKSSESSYEITETIKSICFKARRAWFSLANLPLDKRNEILKLLAKKIQQEKPVILAANEKDLQLARKNKLTSAILDRLTLNDKRLESLLLSLEQIVALPDPLGVILDKTVRPNGLEISKISVPIGVIGMIYESRPNVTIDAAALTLKSGNAVILKGGKESFYTNRSLAFCICETLKELKLPEECVTLIPFKEREAVLELLKQKDKVDLIIPRGGEGLIEFVTNHSQIPVIKHYKGICHVFIDKEADFKKAIHISLNAKVQRPGVCNAMETLLVDREIARDILPALISEYKKENVLLKGCEAARKIDPTLEAATEQDWKTEYLDKILSIRIVDSVQGAIEHIELYGSRHSDSIITENKTTASKFIQNVDSSAVFVNASTRFNDGFEFGLGAEMGISTDKLHARGPMGLKELTTYKYVIIGKGHIRE
ncbi:MAG: glutamate-5-semialdehyde dehydrogenase [Candidatus Aureabacteria bacterium]|nr:glutamate-5-semialdehyde dehydrogenase [Candidatus Auribacterota bacterium]